jgi:hypothetical protein
LLHQPKTTVKMARSLNKFLLLSGCLFLFATGASGQAVNAATGHDDYKDPKTHEKFARRKKMVAAWEINRLKEGALVVRLKTSQKGIDALRKDGKNEEADQKEAEQYLINKYIVRSFLDHYNFSKVYFMYSNYSDSLLDGRRSGFFLDSSLTVNPALKLDGNFYLIAERDYVYNSSLGFIREDSARSVVEAGNPTREMAIVVKNKYNHQLKGPFPYYVKDKTYTSASVPVPIRVTYKGKSYAIPLARPYTYEKYAGYVSEFNEMLKEFHQGNPDPEKDVAYEDAKPFLY